MTPTRVIAASVLALLVPVAARTQADPDLWGHVRFGADILQARGLSPVDPYSFTQDRPWINHEWLSELMMGAAWQWGGTAGLTLLKSLLVVAALLVVWRAYRDADLGWRMAAAAAAVIAGAQLATTLRPQVWSLLAIVVLARELSQRGARRPWIFALLFCLWANSHGGWIVGLAMLGVWAGVEGLRDRSTLPRWTIVAAAAIAGTLVTPYGWRLYAFMLETVRFTRPQIEDWRPLWEVTPAKWVLWALIVAWSAGALKGRGQRAEKGEGQRAKGSEGQRAMGKGQTAAVLFVLAAASVKVVRVLPLFGVASIVLLAPAVASRWPLRPLLPLGARDERIAAAIIAVACAVGAIWIGGSSFRCIGRDRERMPDPIFAAAIAHAPPGRMVTFFNWGEYALWHAGPAIRVSMDGRRETVYSERRLLEHDAILFGRPEGLALLAEWRPEYVWLPASSGVTRQWLTKEGYRLDVVADDAFLAVRADLPVLEASRAELDGRCFPE
jgi:hypothetical protein